MSITLNLYIPNRFTPKVRVLPGQNISILNNIQIFSPTNKMLFIAKGSILSYKKCIKECNLNNGDFIFGLRINNNLETIENLLNSNEEIDISQLKNNIPIFGQPHDVNLTSISRILSFSQDNCPFEKNDIFKKKFINIEVARIHDIKLMKRDNCRKNWRKQINSYLNQDSPDFNCEYTNIFYNAAKEPSCEALPMIL